jgi:hypothetical protein
VVPYKQRRPLPSRSWGEGGGWCRRYRNETPPSRSWGEGGVGGGGCRPEVVKGGGGDVAAVARKLNPETPPTRNCEREGGVLVMWQQSHMERTKPHPNSRLRARGGGGGDVAAVVRKLNPETPPTRVCEREGVVAVMLRPSQVDPSRS